MVGLRSVFSPSRPWPRPGSFDCHTTSFVFTPCQSGGGEDDDDDDNDCKTPKSAVLMFYSLNAPVECTGDVTVAFDCGGDHDGMQTTGGDHDDDDCDDCDGHITGWLPGCLGCPRPVEPSSWGTIKSMYKR